MSKKRKVFFGCSNYPNCDFAINLKPLPAPCPKCGSLMTAYKEKWARCTKCKHQQKLEE
jgi:DNA topoisomerase-1